jgi:small subunit ribosomal protein S1
MVQIDQEIEVMVLRVDRDRERIALGLKQKSASPVGGIEKRYPSAASTRARSSTSCPTAPS